MSKERKDSFIFYRSWYEAVDKLSKKDKTELIRAIIEYNLDFRIPEIDPKIWKRIEPYWILIKPNIDANITKYKNGCKKGSKGKLKDNYANNNLLRVSDEVKELLQNDNKKSKKKYSDPALNNEEGIRKYLEEYNQNRT